MSSVYLIRFRTILEQHMTAEQTSGSLSCIVLDSRNQRCEFNILSKESNLRRRLPCINTKTNTVKLYYSPCAVVSWGSNTASSGSSMSEGEFARNSEQDHDELQEERVEVLNSWRSLKHVGV
jgi:hypothetical protein